MKLFKIALITLLVTSCSSENAPLTFENTTEALDRADSALNAGDYQTAEAGYQFAYDAKDASYTADALIGLFEVACAKNDDDSAGNYFEKISTECNDRLTDKELRRLADLCVLAAAVETGDMIIRYAVSAYPENRDDFSTPATALEKIRTEGPGADLSGLGYAGD